MASSRKLKPLVAMPRIGHSHGQLKCWTCGGDWPSRYDLVVDTEARTIRLDDSQPLTLTRNELQIAQVLIASFPRWITRTQLVEGVWDHLPDVDYPKASGVMKSIKGLQAMLHGSRYTIERDPKLGVRLVDVDTILREQNFERAQIEPLLNGVLKKSLSGISLAVQNAKPATKRGPKKIGRVDKTARKTRDARARKAKTSIAGPKRGQRSGGQTTRDRAALKRNLKERARAHV